MCAIEAGKRGRRVAVLERADRLGKKILISGGGRCNFTNIHCQPENFLSSNSHFAKSALARYTPAHFIALVEKHRIPYHEKTLGQLFCDRSARDILVMLEEECSSAGVTVFLNTKIHEVRRTTEFVAHTASAEFHAPALVVATGGLSIQIGMLVRRRDCFPQHEDSRGKTDHRVCGAHGERRVPRARPGRRDRRLIHSEDRSDFIWLRPGAAVRAENPRAVAGPRTVGTERGG